MLNISESEKLEYLEKLESQSVSLSEDILMILYENSDECIRSELAQTLSLYHNELSEKILVYLLNDTFGMLIWSIGFYTINAFVHFDFLDNIMSPVSIALLNTVFRLVTVCILFPFINKLEKLVCW